MTENEIRKEYSQLTKFLIQNKLSITTMESATSGQIASLITDTEGASGIFKGAFITYSNEAKILQGVSADVIKKYSVYSKETAVAMAEACRKTYKAHIGIGVTGTMGNLDPANPKDSVPGQIYFAISIEEKSFAYFYELSPQPTRLAYKFAVAELVLLELNKILKIK